MIQHCFGEKGVDRLTKKSNRYKIEVPNRGLKGQCVNNFVTNCRFINSLYGVSNSVVYMLWFNFILGSKFLFVCFWVL